jgi:hypothetical protein
MKWNFFYEITAASRTPDWGVTAPQIPVLSVLCPQLNLLNPPNKIPGYATAAFSPTVANLIQIMCDFYLLKSPSTNSDLNTDDKPMLSNRTHNPCTKVRTISFVLYSNSVDGFYALSTRAQCVLFASSFPTSEIAPIHKHNIPASRKLIITALSGI